MARGEPRWGSGADEAVALEDGLQRIPGERVGYAQGLEDACAAGRCGQPLGDVDEQAVARLCHGRGGRHLPEGQPGGFMASVIICW